MNKGKTPNKHRNIALRFCFVLVAAIMVSPIPAPAQQHQQYGNKTNDVRKMHLRKQIHDLQEARRRSPHGHEPEILVNGMSIGNNPQLSSQLRMERQFGQEISDGIGYTLETEPVFTKIQFFEPAPPKTLAQRIDALLFGITAILPTKYDLYGYELRRYMASVASSKTFADRKILAKEFANTKRAAIILDHWDKKIRAEINAISEIIENDESIDSTTRMSFKFNSGKASAFLLEADSWVRNNKKTLDFLYESRGAYEYQHPSMNFASRESANQFKRYFEARQKSVEIIQKYPAFRMMIY